MMPPASSILISAAAVALLSSTVSIDAFLPESSVVSAPFRRMGRGRSSPALFSSYLDQLSSSAPEAPKAAPVEATDPPPELVTELVEAEPNPTPDTTVEPEPAPVEETPVSVFDILSSESGGDGPSNRAIAAAYSYLEAIATGQVGPSPEASGLMAQYIGSLSPDAGDGLTPETGAAIASYLESLSTGRAPLPPPVAFSDYLKKIFMMDIILPQTEADIVSFFGEQPAPTPPPIAPYKKPPAAKKERKEEAFPGIGGVWRTSSGKVVPPPAPAPAAPEADIWKDVVSEADAQAADEARRIFIGGGMLFAGIALRAATGNLLQDAENEIVKDINVVEQEVSKYSIQAEKDAIKDFAAVKKEIAKDTLGAQKAAEAEKRIAEQEAAAKKRTAAEQEAPAAKKAEEPRIANEKAKEKGAEEVEAKLIAKENAAPEKEQARVEAKEKAERMAVEKANLERDAADEYGGIEEKAPTDKAKVAVKASTPTPATAPPPAKIEVAPAPALAPVVAKKEITPARPLAPAPAAAKKDVAIPAPAPAAAKKEVPPAPVSTPTPPKEAPKTGPVGDAIGRKESTSFYVYSQRL